MSKSSPEPLFFFFLIQIRVPMRWIGFICISFQFNLSSCQIFYLGAGEGKRTNKESYRCSRRTEQSPRVRSRLIGPVVKSDSAAAPAARVHVQELFTPCVNKWPRVRAPCGASRGPGVGGRGACVGLEGGVWALLGPCPVGSSLVHGLDHCPSNAAPL